MENVIPYLKFNGNCKEAFEFYKESLDGKLEIIKVKDSPMAEQMSEENQENVLHASLIKDNLKIFGSDMSSSENRNPGNVIICINGSSEEIKSAFEKLSEGGKVTQKLEKAFFGTIGQLTDKYGIPWMFEHYNN